MNDYTKDETRFFFAGSLIVNRVGQNNGPYFIDVNLASFIGLKIFVRRFTFIPPKIFG